MKKIFLFLMCSILLFSFSINNKILKVVSKKMSRQSPTIISKTLRNIDSSVYIKKYMQKISIKKALTPVEKVALVASEIYKKGGVISKLVEKYPIKMANYYAKYGDEFVKIINNFIPKITKINIPPKLSKKYNLSNLEFLKNQEAIGKRFLEVLKYTGKKGFYYSKELFKYLNKHKYATIAGIAFAWFLANPESFNRALESFGNNIEAFLDSISKEVGETVANSINNVSSNMLNSLKEMMSFTTIIFILLIVLLFLLWKFKRVILKFIDLKIAQKEKKVDSLIDETKKRSRYE